MLYLLVNATNEAVDLRAPAASQADSAGSIPVTRSQPEGPGQEVVPEPGP